MRLYIFVPTILTKSLINFKCLTGFALCIWTPFLIFRFFSLKKSLPVTLERTEERLVCSPTSMLRWLLGAHVVWVCSSLGPMQYCVDIFRAVLHVSYICWQKGLLSGNYLVKASTFSFYIFD